MINKLIDPLKILRMLSKNPSSIKLFALNKILARTIPFNAPHNFKLQSINDTQIDICLPYEKVNFNHVKGIHACGLATLGEFCAGLLLLTKMGTEYRLILSHLEASYTYQGKTDVFGHCHIDLEKVKELKEVLKDQNQKPNYQMKTIIVDKNGIEVATVLSTWQIKHWNKVKLKV